MSSSPVMACRASATSKAHRLSAVPSARPIRSPPDIKVFDQAGNLLRTLAKPTASGGGFQPAGPAIDIAFERGLQGGRLFATDSNQATHAEGQNNSSRIVIVDPQTGK